MISSYLFPIWNRETEQWFFIHYIDDVNSKGYLHWRTIDRLCATHDVDIKNYGALQDEVMAGFIKYETDHCLGDACEEVMYE